MSKLQGTMARALCALLLTGYLGTASALCDGSLLWVSQNFAEHTGVRMRCTTIATSDFDLIDYTIIGMNCGGSGHTTGVVIEPLLVETMQLVRETDWEQADLWDYFEAVGAHALAGGNKPPSEDQSQDACTLWPVWGCNY